METTAQEDYRRAVNVEMHETRKVKAVKDPVSRNEKLIYAGMVLVMLINALAIAVKNGWL